MFKRGAQSINKLSWMHRHPIKSAAALVASIGVAAFVWILPVLAQSGVPIVTDTTPPPIGPTHVPLSGGGDALWTGGSLNFPADPDGSAGDGNQVYRGVAATLQADRPACDNGTAMLTVSTRIRNDGPNNGADYTGRLQFFQGTTGLNVDYVTTAPPVGHVETLSVTQSISAADLAAGNITIGLWLETFHAGGKSWTADQFDVSFEYDTDGCTPPPSFTCNGDGILFQNPTSPNPPYEVTGVDLVTGLQDPMTTTSGGQVNGVGYNVLDNYVYGIRANNDGSGTWSLVQVGSDGSIANLGQPIGMSSIVNYASGDVDANGHYWTLNNIANEWYEVDLVPSSSTYLKVISSGTTNVDLGDWVWINGALYGQQGAAGSEQLVRFTPATGFQTVGPLPDVSGTIGAAFTDGTYFYGSVNDNGDIFRIDPTTLETDLISTGQPSVGNDGARCPIPLHIDFGDAPDSYGSLLNSDGPRHGVPGYNTTDNTAPLMLGSLLDTEVNGLPSVAADGDNNDDIDDEEGAANPIQVYEGEDTSVNVTVTNNTNEVATLAGWIDLNANGAFDAGERQVVSVPANSGAQVYSLTFAAANLTSDSFARFRVFPGTVSDPQPTGSAAAGEVEDYAVSAGSVRYTKTISPDNAPALTPGSTFTYTVNVENTGSAPLTDLMFNDDMSDVVDDATYNNDVNATIGTATFNGPDQMSWAGDLAVGETATVTYSVTVNNPISGDGILINGIVGDGPGSNCTDIPATNPDCLTRAPQPDISSTKEVVSPAGNPQAGDTVTYRFTVVNDGAAAATSVNVSDSLSGVLDDAVYNNDATASSGTASFSATNQQLNWQGDLAANGDAGDTVTVDFTVTLNAADAMGDGVLQNGLISADCPNPPIYDTSDPDYDPSCVTSTPVEAWTTRKTATPTGRISANTDVTYTVEVKNTGGADLTGLSFNDTLTAILDDAAYNNDASATSGTTSYTDPAITWNGDLSVDQTATVTYSVTVNDADSLGDGLLNNAVTDSMNCPDPAVTNVNDPNFNPDCVVHHEIAAWTIVKQSTPGPVEAGDDVTYTITVENTGGTNLTGADAPRFRDDLGDVVDDATYNNNATATIGTPTYAEPILTWQNDLLVGETSTITYTTTVNDASPDGNGVMTNALLGGECPDPAITDSSDPSFNPDCVTITNVSEWIATKQVTPTTNVKPGNVLTYTVSVENTGGVDLTGADAPEVTDDLTALLDDATYNNDEAATTGTISYGAPNVTWTGDLSIGDSGQFSYSATVNDADALGDGRINNAITGSPNCPDPAVTDSSDPSFNPDCVTINLVEAWTVTKSNNATGAVSAGDVVDYTLTLENTGGADLPGISTRDDMSGVLDDAAYNNNATASVGSTSFNSPHLTWTGDLTAGTTATVNYSVTINEASADGDGTLQNAIVGGMCPDPAITNSSDPNFNPDCVNILGVSEWIASKTADPEGAIDPNTTVNYTVTVENTGGVDLTGAEAPALNDDFTEVQDDATYNNDASATIGTPTYTDPTLSWSNDLSVGQTSVITYSFTAHDDGDFGDGILANAITGSPNCPDPAITDPDDPNFDPNCVPVRYIKAFDVDKSSNPEDGSEVEAGETIDYTVTIHNTGALDLTNFNFDDDLSDVLDDATLTGNPTVTPSSMGTTTQNGDTLTFNGDIPIGETATVTYSATVNEDAPADASIRNVIVGLFSNCITGEEEECITTHTVTEGGFLAETGINSWLYVIFGSLLTVIGVGVIYVKKIKRKGWT